MSFLPPGGNPGGPIHEWGHSQLGRAEEHNARMLHEAETHDLLEQARRDDADYNGSDPEPSALKRFGRWLLRR